MSDRNQDDEEEARYDEQSWQDTLHNDPDMAEEVLRRQNNPTLLEKIRQWFGSDDGVI